MRGATTHVNKKTANILFCGVCQLKFTRPHKRSLNGRVLPQLLDIFCKLRRKSYRKNISQKTSTAVGVNCGACDRLQLDKTNATCMREKNMLLTLIFDTFEGLLIYFHDLASSLLPGKQV
jgi:hypothetical protein